MPPSPKGLIKTIIVIKLFIFILHSFMHMYCIIIALLIIINLKKINIIISKFYFIDNSLLFEHPCGIIIIVIIIYNVYGTLATTIYDCSKT